MVQNYDVKSMYRTGYKNWKEEKDYRVVLLIASTYIDSDNLRIRLTKL